MRKNIILLLLFSSFQLFSQNNQLDYIGVIKQERPDFYFAIGSGIDNYTGIIGIGAYIPIAEKLMIRGGAGIGGWGGKLSLGIKYQDLMERGVGFGLGYSYCSGLSDFDAPLPDQNGEEITVNMDLKSAGSINLTVNKNWVFPRGNVFYIESGYAIGVGKNPFYEINDGTILSENADLILNVMRPGGLILAIGLLVAF